MYIYIYIHIFTCTYIHICTCSLHLHLQGFKIIYIEIHICFNTGRYSIFTEYIHFFDLSDDPKTSEEPRKTLKKPLLLQARLTNVMYSVVPYVMKTVEVLF